MTKNFFLTLVSFVFTLTIFINADDPNRLPTKCEICKYLTVEIAESLNTKFNSHELIETGYTLDERLSKKKAKKYRDSEIRLIEVVESVCESILSYNVHAERSGSLRYAKGESQTMGTLKGLKNRGVKVELGIPYDLWDTPSAEITQLKKYCDHWSELYEEQIETWYWTERENISLTDYLCDKLILKEEEKACLSEVFVPEPEKPETASPAPPKKEEDISAKRILDDADEPKRDNDRNKEEEGETEEQKRERRGKKKREWERNKKRREIDREREREQEIGRDRERDRDRYKRYDDEHEREQARRERMDKERNELRERRRREILEKHRLDDPEL